MLAVNAGGLTAPRPSIPGFPTSSYLTFALAVPFMQGALFSVMNAGTDLARDIETGFLNRLPLTPCAASRCSPASWRRVVARRCSRRSSTSRRADRRRRIRRGRPPASLVLLALVGADRASASARSALFAALRTGSGEAVQGLFPVFFVSLFLSSMYLPRNLIRTHWFRDVATVTRSPTCSRRSAAC